MGLLTLPALALLTLVAAWAVSFSLFWLVALVPVALLLGVGIWDIGQKKHSVLRNYPVVGHLRFLLEAIRPEMQQYFVERDFDGRPFDRNTRSVIYERAKGIHGDKAFGTELEVEASGYEFLEHSIHPEQPTPEQPRVTIGGPDCTHPYPMALLNVSGMSFGALSAHAILALNKGAKAGGFAHDTGEGGISPYHREGGADLVWEIGSGYFGTRTPDGDFDPSQFQDKAADPQVKCVELKLSQGAKPGLGGVLPGPKVSRQIAEIRGVPEGVACISPAAHRVFQTPRELVLFLARMRELAAGKPTGFKLCVGSRREFLAVCKAMLAEGVTPDFIVVDGSEGGTGAAPLEFEDNIGMPLTQGLLTVHNALVGVGLRDRIRIGASGKVARGTDIVKRIAQGADYTNAARAMMMATGCIQAQKCHTNHCPVGVTTQDPKRYRALDVADKSKRVQRFQAATVAEAQQILAAMGLAGPHELRPEMVHRRVSQRKVSTYTELYRYLQPRELLAGSVEGWDADWQEADPDTFRAVAAK